MPLDVRLMNVDLTHQCPHCGHERTMKGRWFSMVGNYRCAACRADVRMTYVAKAGLFESHSHLAEPLSRCPPATR
jgi:DNA-directed RNA polymerase subunit RPC12/RpoP